MNRLLIILLFLTTLVSCEEGPTVQTGDVIGNIGYYEKEFVNYIDSLEGVKVILSNDEVVLETTSLPDGTFRFTDVKAGNYKLSLEKDFYAYYYNGVFVFSALELPVTHLGGGITNTGLVEFYEAPDYMTVIDSYEWLSDTVLLLNLSIPPGDQDFYPFNIYLSEQQDVGPDNFDYLWPSGYSFNYFENPMTIDTVSGRISLKLPLYRNEVDHYFSVAATSVWSYDLLGPASDPVHIQP